MRPTFHLIKFVAILSIVMGCGSPELMAQKKKTSVPAIAADYSRLVEAKYLTGNLIAFDEPNDTLTVRVDIPYYEPNPSYRPPSYQAQAKNQAGAQVRQIQQQQRQQQTLYRLQLQVTRARTPQQHQQAMMQVAREMGRIQYQQAQNAARLQAETIRNVTSTAKNASSAAKNPNSSPYKVVTVSKVFELNVAPDVVVRKMFLPTEFDDIGNIKVYTEREKAALRGSDSTKPGYDAKATELVPGQELKLYLAPARNTKRDIRPDDEFGEPIARPVVTLIVLTRELTR